MEISNHIQKHYQLIIKVNFLQEVVAHALNSGTQDEEAGLGEKLNHFSGWVKKKLSKLMQIM